MELTDIRARIDEIDRELTRLFADRMALSEEVAAYKQAHNLPVLDAARERSKLAVLSEQVPEELRTPLALLYQQIFALSRARQNELLQPETELTRRLAAALTVPPRAFPGETVVACQGVEGAYSQHAAERLFRRPNLLYFSTFEGVVRAVEEGLCDYGVLPAENSAAGNVAAVAELLGSSSVFIVRALRLKVDHCLLALPGATRDRIRQVLSHPQALAQCRAYLAALPGAEAVPCANTAEAARRVAEAGRSDLAALGSRDCAALYGLQVLEESVQDHGGNFTRFFCISREPEIFPGADRTAVTFTLPHQPGALCRVLELIHALGVNLSRLRSRPLPNRDFEFVFDLELETSVYAPEFLPLLRELEAACEGFRYLGSYSEVV